ncbi:hypothetical protein BT63DRAFT_437410 [Microthyrium microscopicum]|uniref:Mitochondrial carrier n=1 Tax=Microthyrium microscopicum TaxID=703497 RepID=A0A6A6UQX3_9PEZI|nr:hypothetical protein BT63DRAFT_437410 [Microthyrium microscopicum]
MESLSSDGSYSPYAKTSRDQPNPLRPYYNPPSIGIAPTQSPSGAASSPSGHSVPPLPPRDAPSNSTNRDFRELFSDLDYGDYLPDASPSVAELAKRLMDQAIWNYTSVLLAQPFEVAKVVLQCYDAGSAVQENGPQVERSSYMSAHDFNHSDSDSDSDTPSYFMPTSPEETPSHRASKRMNLSRLQSTASQAASSPPQSLTTMRLKKADSVLEVIALLWGKEGATGVWKGTNSTFIYGVLLKTIETWTRSCLSAILDIPDPSLVNASIVNVIGPTILDSPSPIASLSVIVASAAIAGCLLAPVDMVRTRLILTPTSSTPRALLPSLRALPSLSCPPTILSITVLHSTIPTLLSTSLPLFIRNWLRIDPIHTPSTYSVTAFLISLCELFVKLPLETVLRRGHIAVLNAPPPSLSNSKRPSLLPIHTTGLHTQKFKPIVATGPYRGVLGSILYIIYEEGHVNPTSPSIPTTPSRASSSLSNRSRHAEARHAEARRQPARKRGQGLPGLWRGWRVGFWGIVGMYAAAGLGGGGQSGGEF